MVYYTIYVKNLHTNTGYIDVALPEDQLLKDFIQLLDVGLRSHRTYPLVDVGGKGSGQGQFAINLADVAAFTAIPAS
jgi:hypothetical protein